MPDSFVEVSQQGWGSRIAGSLKGILFGVVLFLGSFVVLFKNEGCAVRDYQTQKEGAKTVVAVAAARLDPANTGKLVHVSGEATTTEVLRDALFPVEAQAIRLTRTVEMYQWREEEDSRTEKKLGGGTETITTYKYTKDWSEELNKSGRFKEAAGHENPATMPYQTAVCEARTVTVGAFRLSPALIKKIRRDEALPLTAEHVAKLPANLQGKAALDGQGLFVGASAATPQVGDLRLRFQVVRPSVVSIVAQQTAQGFQAYQTRAGGILELLAMGERSAAEMFQAEEAATRNRTWLVRALGVFMMAMGIFMVLRPLAVLADVIPVLGSFVGAGLSVAAAGVALALSAVTIALAWLAYRPWVSVPLLLAAGGIAGWLVARTRRRRAVPPPVA